MDRRIHPTTLLFLLCLASLPASAASDGEVSLNAFLAANSESTWSGRAELWIDPTGYEVERSDATLHVTGDRLEYDWSWRGAAQSGAFAKTLAGLSWQDSWHQAEVVALQPQGDDPAIFAVEYAYDAGAGPDWHWRMRLSQRPDGQLALQMTNVTPWGEEARAVRMVFERME